MVSPSFASPSVGALSLLLARTVTYHHLAAAQNIRATGNTRRSLSQARSRPVQAHVAMGGRQECMASAFRAG